MRESRRLHPVVVLALLASLAALLVAVQTKRLADARHQYDSRRADLDRVVEESREIVRLRNEGEKVSLRERPANDVLAQVNAILVESGIPTSRLTEFRPESDMPLPDVARGPNDPLWHRQSIVLHFNELTMTDLGSFLSRFGGTQELWSPTRIEIIQPREPARQKAGQYQVHVVISAIYCST